MLFWEGREGGRGGSLISTAFFRYSGISVAIKNGALYISHVEPGRLAHVQGRAILSSQYYYQGISLSLDL